MNYLFIFKRFEIWLLIGVVAGLLVFAFQPVEEETSVVVVEKEVTIKTLQVEEPPAVVVAQEEETGFRITKVNVEPTEQGQVIELTLLAQSKSEAALVVDEKTIKATTNTGVAVPHFFEPFKTFPTVEPGEDSLVTVRLWLEGSAESIWLDFQGDRAEAELPEAL